MTRHKEKINDIVSSAQRGEMTRTEMIDNIITLNQAELDRKIRKVINWIIIIGGLIIGFILTRLW